MVHGWRGCFAEYRLWVALHHRLQRPCRHSATKPLARSWYCTALLDEVATTLGSRLDPILDLMQSLKFSGAPDLFLWHPSGPCLFVEVKSSTDTLRPEQNLVLQKLVKFPDIRCMVAVTATLTNAQRNKPWQVYSDSDTD